MKYVILLFLMLGNVMLVSAAPGIPSSSVWVEPATAAPGQAIELNAFIYNSEKQNVTYTVSFRVKNEQVTQASATISPKVAKAVIGQWKQPQKTVDVTAVIVKAVGKDGKEITALHGELGTITVGVEEEKKESSKASLPDVKLPKNFPSIGEVKGFINTKLSKLEAYRQRQAEKYAQLKTTARSEAGIGESRELVRENEKGETVVERIEKPTFVAYGQIMVASALASFFGSYFIFYISVILLTFMVIRFIFRRFI